MDIQNFKNWESSLGFKSLKTIFDDFVFDENEMWDQLVIDYEDNENQLTKEIVKEKYNSIKKNKENSIVRVKMEDDEYYYNMNLYRSNLAPIVNKDGIVTIGEEIYRFTMEDERILHISNSNMINHLFKEYSKDVRYTRYSLLKNEPPIGDNCPRQLSGYTAYHEDYTTTDDYHRNWPLGDRRNLINFQFWQKSYHIWDNNCNYSTFVKTDFNVNVRSLKKVFGFWVNYTASRITYFIKHSGSNLPGFDLYFGEFDVYYLPYTIYVKKSYSPQAQPILEDAYFYVEVNDWEGSSINNLTRIYYLNGVFTKDERNTY